MAARKRYPEKEAAWKASHNDQINLRRRERRNRIAATVEGKEYLRRRGYEAQLRHKYGMSIEDRDALLKSQGGRCGITGCERVVRFGGKGGAAVDHCHDTGKVRGILCATCNKGLGQLGDTLDRLRAAVAYLERST